jgi:DNA-binding MarR family transcriptional regulator
MLEAMTPKLAEAHECVSFALRKAARTVTRHYDAALRSAGMRSTQFNLLVVLDTTGPITTTALAQKVAIERTTLTRNLALLARRGWVRVERERSDRRARWVSLTEHGRRAALEALPTWRGAQGAVAIMLGLRETAALRQLLDTLTREEL